MKGTKVYVDFTTGSAIHFKAKVNTGAQASIMPIKVYDKCIRIKKKPQVTDCQIAGIWGPDHAKSLNGKHCG